jgi:hypothetical protein
MAKAAKAKAKFTVGDNVTFKGYADDVPENERLLTEGDTYHVVDVNAEEDSLGVEIDNPDFNAKKKESENNQKMLVVDVFFDEVDIAAEDDASEEEADAEEEEAPAPKAKGKTTAKAPAPVAKGKTKAKDVEAEDEADDVEEDGEEEAPAPKAKGKTVAKAAPAAKGKATAKGKAAPAAKGKAKAEKKAKEAPVEVDESETLPALEEEDAEIVELIDGADLVELASELVEDSAALDYKLGGVLYHLRLGKSYQDVDKKYAVKGGWQLFIEENLGGLGYRKAMHLIDIYYKFNLYGIAADKVQELGWTKCSKIAQVMTDTNAEELVELATESSVAELSDTIKESYKEVGGEKGEKRRKVAFKFRLWDDQAAGVEQVIAEVQETMGFKDPSDAFEHIVMEWAAEHGSEPKTKAPAKTAAKATAPAKATAKVRGKA